MTEDTKELARRAMQLTLKRALENAKRPKAPKPPPEAAYADPEPAQKSEDALDRQAFRKGGFSKAEKQAYAKQKFAEELVTPPRDPPPAWMDDNTLLPRKPPPRRK